MPNIAFSESMCVARSWSSETLPPKPWVIKIGSFSVPLRKTMSGGVFGAAACSDLPSSAVIIGAGLAGGSLSSIFSNLIVVANDATSSDLRNEQISNRAHGLLCSMGPSEALGPQSELPEPLLSNSQSKRSRLPFVVHG